MTIEKNVHVLNLDAPQTVTARGFYLRSRHRPLVSIADLVADGAGVGAVYLRCAVDVIDDRPACSDQNSCQCTLEPLLDSDRMLSEYSAVFDPTLRF